MLNIICTGNESHFDWLLKWCAHMVQVPMINGQVAVVMRGGEGCGKGTLGHVLRRIAGSHGYYVSNQKGVVGNFNAHLANRLLLFADEAFFAGDKQHEGVLKALVSESVISIEPKGVDSYQQANYLRLVMATNNKWAVPAGAEARRFFVLDVPNTKTGDKAYFDALYAEIDNGGLAAFLHDLLQVDLTGWNRAHAPKTAGLMDQKLFSLRGVQRWYYTRLARAETDGPEIKSIDLRKLDGPLEYDDREVWVWELSKTQLYDEYTRWSRDQKAEYQPVSDSQFWKDLREMAPSLTTERKRKAGRKAMVHLPPLAKARDEFENFMGDKVPWSTDGSDEDEA
jgi:phage/plasmid-associated DNA primase